MRFAIFLESLNFDYPNHMIRKVYLFDLVNEIITAAGEDMLYLINMKYLQSWLIAKKVECIYIRDIPRKVRKLIMNMGIKVKELEELRDNPLMDVLLFK